MNADMSRRSLRRWRSAALVALAAGAAALPPARALATPQVPLDDPVYLEIDRLRAGGQAAAFTLSGVRPLTEAQLQALLTAAEGPAAPERFLVPRGGVLWLRPVARLSTRVLLADDPLRPFSVPARFRFLEGGVQLACEHQEGRPCGHGVRGFVELDSAAGVGPWVALASRVRAKTGAGGPEDETGLDVDRLILNVELGPIELAAGRNVVLVGPGVRTQLGWGDTVPPLDHVALKVSSLKVPRLPLAVGGMALIGRLSPPQRYPGTLVTIARGYMEIAHRLVLGLANVMELGGEGAPEFSFGDFFLEHLTRTGPFPGQGISNRRVFFDGSWAVPALRSVFYYELAFEDWRDQFVSAFRHDADHLLGWYAPALGAGGRFGILVEAHRTGKRSYEHELFSSGMTSGARPIGSPLGPDAFSLFVSPRVDHGAVSFWPWVELVRLGSDVFAFPEGAAIVRQTSGPVETRWRGGLRAMARPQSGVWLSGAGFVERVTQEAFVAGATRTNIGLWLTATWAPGWELRR